MVVIVVHIAQQDGSMVQAIDYNIDFSVVEQVAKSRAARGNHIGQPGPLDWRNNFEFLAVIEIMEEHRALRERGPPVMLVYLRVHMA